MQAHIDIMIMEAYVFLQDNERRQIHIEVCCVWYTSHIQKTVTVSDICICDTFCIGYYLKFIKYCPMMKICMRKDSVHSPTNRSQLRHWWLFDTHSENEVHYDTYRLYTCVKGSEIQGMKVSVVLGDGRCWIQELYWGRTRSVVIYSIISISGRQGCLS
jgi:hypothetical protein